jgi:hypothetical protein
MKSIIQGFDQNLSLKCNKSAIDALRYNLTQNFISIEQIGEFDEKID